MKSANTYLRRAFGVDIGGTSIKTGFFSIDGKILRTCEIPTRTEKNGSFILEDIAKAVDDILRKERVSKRDVEGIGIGIPGPVTRDGKVLRCVNLGWGVFNAEEALSSMTGLKVKAANDANAAALGEMWMGSGRGFSDMVMVTLGTGVGGGVIVRGSILAGADGAAAEIGHIQVREDETQACACGGYGCVEQYASANGIVRMTRLYLDANPGEDSSLRRMGGFTSKEICEEARNGDAVSIMMLEEACRLLGRTLASVACTVNPQAFVIGGGMSKAGDILLNSIERNYRRYAFHASRNTKFRLASLGNDAGMYGCVRMLLD